MVLHRADQPSSAPAPTAPAAGTAFVEPKPLADIKDALVIKEGILFLLTDSAGNVPPNNLSGYGLYQEDTRYLSGYALSLGAVRPMVLLSTAELGYSAEQDLTNPDMLSLDGRHIPAETLEIRRLRVLHGCLSEIIYATSYNIFPASLELHLTFDADFADMFEVRGWNREQRGAYFPPQVSEDAVVFAYEGLDGRRRETRVSFSPAPSAFYGTTAVFRLDLEHRRTSTIRLTVSMDGQEAIEPLPDAFERLFSSYRAWQDSCARVWTDNEFFNSAIERALRDLRMLRSDLGESQYIAAGTPWYTALFGRDSLIVGMQYLPYNPDIARGILRLLATMQGKELNPERDEEPGKILHELRVGEMARLGEIPMTPYYGTVDATPLFLMLLSQYYQWTGDVALVQSLLPAAEAALTWIARYGDRDRDGYVEYLKYSPKGIANQGWKDSWDSVVHADGTLAEPPIALIEVQGYVYASKLGMALIYDALGQRGRAAQLRAEAQALKKRLNQDFWVSELGFYAMALDGHKQPVASVSSNPGHALWTGTIDAGRVPEVVDRLLGNDMFSGWGIRTLSSTNPRYNPMGYHLGTVWPHDNALAALGMKRYGFEPEVNEIATALYDACRSFDYHRLPELYSGAQRTGHDYPVRYPVACRPQAWAAGSLLMVLQAILGLEADALKGRLTVRRPRLPHWLREVEVRNIRVGDGAADLLFRKRRGVTNVSILGARGGLRVSVVH
ncbi:MAG: amylo-alpha-1,6-glucosidase [Chloroflexi bacterium]|nr:amylo-alpha-1,6-glucosidase [Chloroflexota bacterium]